MSLTSQQRNRTFYDKHREEILQDRAVKKVAQSKGMVVQIVHDPLPEGGFRKGSELNCVDTMLRFLSFTPGTILTAGNKTFRVAQSMGRQTLVWIEQEI